MNDSTRSTARDLAVQAKSAFARGDYEQARDLFHRAYTLVPAPTISLNEARALVKLHRLVEASEAYMRSVRTSLDSESPEQFRKAVRDAEFELVALRPRIPKLTVVASGPGSQDPQLMVTLDQATVSSAVLGVETPIDPGQHRLTAQAPGGEKIEEIFAVEEKEKKRVEIQVPGGRPPPAAQAQAQAVPLLAPADTPIERSEVPARSPSSTQKVVGYTSIGIGAAGLAIGIVTGIKSNTKYSQAVSGCPRRVCVAGSEGDDALQSFRSLRTVSTIGYVASGVGLAVGVTLLLTAPSRSLMQSRAVHPWIGAGQAGLAGAF